MGNTVSYRGNIVCKLTEEIEKLKTAEKIYLDQIHVHRDKERCSQQKIDVLEWKMNNGISKLAYIKLMRIKNGKDPSEESLRKFDNSDINNDGFLTFEEFQNV